MSTLRSPLYELFPRPCGRMGLEGQKLFMRDMLHTKTLQRHDGVGNAAFPPPVVLKKKAHLPETRGPYPKVIN